LEGISNPSLTGDGKRAYFVRATSSCGGSGSSGGIWVVSTDGGPASAVVASPPQDVDLGPIVSADGRVLVWERTTCGKVGLALYVRNLESGAQRVISVASDVEVAPVAWAPDDRHLLFTTFSSGGQSAGVLDTATAASTNNAVRLQASPCDQRFPRFLPDATLVALTCSPTAGGKPGDALAVFDPVTGKELRVLQEGIPLPPPSDAAFDVSVMSFSCSSDGASAIWATVPNGAERQANVWRWADGRVVQLSVLANEVTW
jgi:Tol biopolymer transport system component